MRAIQHYQEEHTRVGRPSANDTEVCYCVATVGTYSEKHSRTQIGTTLSVVCTFNVPARATDFVKCNCRFWPASQSTFYSKLSCFSDSCLQPLHVHRVQDCIPRSVSCIPTIHFSYRIPIRLCKG